MGKKKGSVLHVWQIRSRTPGPCGRCGRISEYLTVDHIIPMSFLQTVGLGAEIGYTDNDNFQLLCRTCNTLKGNRFDFSDPRTMANLKRYVILLEQIHTYEDHGKGDTVRSLRRSDLGGPEGGEAPVHGQSVAVEPIREQPEVGG